MSGAHRTPTRHDARARARSPGSTIDHAVVARNADDGAVTVTEVSHPGPSGSDATYLARVVDEIGDQERLVTCGPERHRLALEREYVTIYHRPDRLLDVEPSGPVDRAALVAGLQDAPGLSRRRRLRRQGASYTSRPRAGP